MKQKIQIIPSSLDLDRNNQALFAAMSAHVLAGRAVLRANFDNTDAVAPENTPGVTMNSHVGFRFVGQARSSA
ncbi:hypothetical protein [Rheinheimera sp.]|uniref:hypothetical protein n=1 Tax=Rheinheimera sp. TaxID=1869214 RepID=UPI003D28602B